jgi:hypothetical protein
MSHVMIDAAQRAATETPEGTVFEMVPIEKLFLDNAYGRHLSDKNLNRLRNGWSLHKMGTLYVSLRSDGRYAVIDGWHRKTIAQEYGVEALPCYVYLDLSLADEAALYEAFGTVFTQSPLVKFRARLVAGDPVAVDIDRVVHEAGLRINYTAHNVIGVNRTAKDIGGVVGIEMIYRGYGRDHLLRVLTIAQGWFPEQADVMRDVVLRGLSAFLIQYVIDPKAKPYCDMKRMALKCSRGIDPILRRANSIRVDERLTMPTAFGKALRSAYNEGFSQISPNRLPEWRDNIVSPNAARQHVAARAAGAAARRREVTPANGRARHAVFNDIEIADMPN